MGHNVEKLTTKRINQSFNQSTNHNLCINLSIGIKANLKFPGIRIDRRHLTEHFERIVVLQCIVEDILDGIFGAVEVFQVE